MALSTIRARPETRDRLNQIARHRGLSMPDLLEDLVQRAEDDAMIAASNDRFAELRSSGEIEGYAAETAGWERTAGDGIAGE